MSENMIGTISVVGKNFSLNWPYNQDDFGQTFNPNYASACLLNDSGDTDYDNFTLVDIKPVSETIFTSEQQVFDQAEQFILKHLVVDFLVGENASSAQIEKMTEVVETGDNKQLTEILTAS